jgi:DNA-binding MarR family transcriptional regulator
MELFRRTASVGVMAAPRRPSEATLDLWRRWLRANRLLGDRLDADLRAACGITLDEYDVLVQLGEASGARRRMSDLADALLLARSSCTRIVGRLEADGLVRRHADERDGRVTWAVLTRDGKRRLRRAAVVHLRGVQDGFGRHVRPEDHAALDRVLARMLAGGADQPPSTDTVVS